MLTTLAACGGGGGTPSPSPAPAPTPTPTPTPTPPPLQTNFTVGPGGQFATFAQAFAVIGDRTAATRATVTWLPGTIGGVATAPDFVDIVGSALSILDFTGDPALPFDMQRGYDPLLLRGSNRITRGSIITRNSNYCIHSESGGAFRNFHQVIEQMRLVYETDNGIPNIGVGMSSGGLLEILDNELISPAGGIYVHNTTNQELPCVVRIRGGVNRPAGPYSYGLTVSTLGSGTVDRIELDNADLGDYVLYQTPADFEITGTVSRPFAFHIQGPDTNYRPRIINQEAELVNIGGTPIALGTLVVRAGLTCRTALPGDVANIGIASEPIPVGAAGRVQVSGWINPALLVTNVPQPGLGDTYVPGVLNGVPGAAVYAGNTGSVLRCIREAKSSGPPRALFVPAICEVS